MINRGTKYAMDLFVKYSPPNRAIAVMGVKFGRCGSSLNKTATSINTIINNCFLDK
jgi:hypothetical protein